MAVASLMAVGHPCSYGFHDHGLRSVPVGRFLAVIGSSGLLEVAVRDGSAARTTGAKLGDKVIVFGASNSTVVERTIERTRVSKKRS